MSRYKKYASEEQLNRHLRLSRCTAQLPSGMKKNYITYGNGKYVAVASGTNKCAYSSDGVNWTEVQLPENSYCKKIVYGNGMYVILSSYKSGTYVNEIMCSNDGVNWLKTSIPCNAEIVDITYGSGIFVAIPRSHYSVYYSKDGSEWNSKDEFCSSKWTSVTYGNGCFVACGIGGCDVLSPPDGDAIIIYKSNIAYSYDGINWNGFYEDKFDSNVVTKVVYGNGRFIILSYNSLTGVYSENGKDWTQLTIPAKVNHDSLTFGNGKFVVFTTDGLSVLTSSDGIDWDIHELQTQFNVRDIAYGKDRFIATLSDSASAIISYDGENWYEEDALLQGSEDVTSAVKAVLGLENAASKDYVDAGLEEAKEYTDRICRIEKTIITWDGDRTVKTVVGDDYFTYVRLYSAVAPETITKAAVMTIGGAVEYTADAFTITELSGTGYAISINSMIGILVVPEDCDFAIAGTYAATNCDGAPTTSTEFYTSCIETEIIHPIDQKFLPEETLDLTKPYIEGITSINDVVFLIISKGGGTIGIPGGANEFWKDAHELRPKYLNLSDGVADIRITVSAFRDSLDTDGDMYISGSSIVSMNNVDMEVKCSLGSDTGTDIIIKAQATPIEFPELELNDI